MCPAGSRRQRPGLGKQNTGIKKHGLGNGNIS